MNLFLWILAGLLAAAMLGAGVMKLSQPKDKLAASGQAWVEDFSAGAVKAIGALEVLAAVSLILPAVLGIATIFVPLAAAGIVALMIGAAVTHARRREYPMIGVNAVLGGLALVVAIFRFGSYSF